MSNTEQIPTFPQRMSPRSSNSRMLWMDIVRGAAILAVIAFHSVTMLERYGFEADRIWRYLNETLKLFRMPILIVLSGMLLPRSLAKPAPEYFSGKLRGILWPYLIWSTIYAVVADVDFTSPAALGNLYMGGSHLWFLAFIFLYYLAAKPLERINPLVVVAVAFFLSLLSPDGAKYSERILFLMSLFFLGSAATRHAEQIGKLLASRWIWLLLPIVAGSALATVLYNLNFGPYWAAMSLAGVLFFAAIAKRVEPLAISGPLIWIGQRSIVFYVSHAVFIITVAKLFLRAGMMNYAVAAVASMVVSLAGGWVLAVGTAKWGPVGWLFSLPKPRWRLSAERQLQ